MKTQMGAHAVAQCATPGSDSEADSEAHVSYFPSLTQTQRRWLAARLEKLDRSTVCSTAPLPHEGGLFEFQHEAAEWLRERLEHGREHRGYSLIEMEAGCGKTRAVGAFIQRTSPRDARILFLTQGGLVRQTREELERVVSGLFCRKAESTKEFNKHWHDAHEVGVVVVVNIALTRAWLSVASSCWCVVLDEAHRISASVVGRLGACVPSSSLIFMSGTPTSGSALATLAARASDSQHFVFKKKGDVAEKLCMPRVLLNGVATVETAAPPDAAHAVIGRAFLTAPSATGPLLCALLLCAEVGTSSVASSRAEQAWDIAAHAWDQANDFSEVQAAGLNGT